MKPKTILSLIVILISLIILIQNTEVVTFSILFWKLTMSKIVLLVITIILGFLIGFLIRPTVLRKKYKIG